MASFTLNPKKQISSEQLLVYKLYISLNKGITAKFTEILETPSNQGMMKGTASAKPKWP
jgi:hypothetical protein